MNLVLTLPIMNKSLKKSAPNNRTLIITDIEKKKLSKKLVKFKSKTSVNRIKNKVINSDHIKAEKQMIKNQKAAQKVKSRSYIKYP